MLPHLRAAGLVCAWLESDGCDGPQMAVVELRKSFRPQKLKKKKEKCGLFPSAAVIQQAQKCFLGCSAGQRAESHAEQAGLSYSVAPGEAALVLFPLVSVIHPPVPWILTAITAP